MTITAQKSNPDFDSWIEFYNANEEWLSKSILFLESRLPFDVDKTLQMLARETDELKRHGMWTSFEGPMLVHIGIVLKFRMVTADMPLLSHRLQMLNALVSANASGELDSLLKETERTLTVEEDEKIHLRHYLMMAKDWCERAGASFEKFCELNALILVGLTRA